MKLHTRSSTEPAGPPSLLAGLVRSEVMVSLLGGPDEGFRGLLWAADDSGVLVVSSAASPVLHYVAGEEPAAVDGGRLFVPAGNVKSIQVVDGSG